MTTFSKIDHDLLLLIKGHYGVFNDATALDRIAKLMTLHCAISFELARKLDTISYWLGALLVKADPEFFATDRNIIDLLRKFSINPEEGMRWVIGHLATVRCLAEDGTVLIALPDPDPHVQEYLDRPGAQYE
jgi:hypothetical protein